MHIQSILGAELLDEEVGMDRNTRGAKNLQRMYEIQADGGRGVVTFWNPTQSESRRVTIHFTTADLMAKLYQVLPYGWANAKWVLKISYTVEGVTA